MPVQGWQQLHRLNSKIAFKSDMTHPASSSCVRLPAGGSSSLSLCLRST